MDRSHQIVFGILRDPSKPHEPDTLVLVLHDKAWEHIAGGKQEHQLDLTKIGIPIKLAIMRTKTQEDAIKLLNPGKDALDVRGLDLGFGKEG